MTTPVPPRRAGTIVVIDDDPTGSQTVHSCPLLLRWDVETLRRGLRHPSPLLFVLANTRALTAPEAEARNREIVVALAEAMQLENLAAQEVLLVSRGDSTLRGHGVLEPQVLAEEWQARFEPVDATLHVPAFLPGGRTTINGVHLLNGEPVHTTAFAQDRLFGYSTSDLAAWLDEKSAGRISAASVVRLDLELLDGAAASVCGEGDPAGLQALLARLIGMENNCAVVVDALRSEQLQALGVAVHQLKGRKRFLFRSAASLLNGLLDGGPEPLGPQPMDPVGLARLRRVASSSDGGALPGLVLLGSHVPLADRQLRRLLQASACRGVELPVARIARVLEGGHAEWLLADLEAEWRDQLQQILISGCTPVLYTSRGELPFGSGEAAAARRLHFGMALARLMARLVAAVADQLGYVISKGGITTGTLLAEGLQLPAMQLEGQLLPGLSLVRPMEDGASETVAGLPIVTFPGNLGDDNTLLEAWRLMQGDA